MRLRILSGLEIFPFLKKGEPSSSSPSGIKVEEQSRTFSISINKALRKNLPRDIENVVEIKVETSLENSNAMSIFFSRATVKITLEKNHWV